MQDMNTLSSHLEEGTIFLHVLVLGEFGCGTSFF